MSPFGEILQIVLDEPAVMQTLTSAATDDALFALLVTLGQERGIVITTDELATITRNNRRAWLERWLAV